MTEDLKEGREEKRIRQMTEIYAALGKYVEAFEQVGAWVRSGCVTLTSILVPSSNLTKQQQLMLVVFSHESMTAFNLFSIYRSLVHEFNKEIPVEQQEKIAIEGILRQFDTEYQKALKSRNDYLHGTWFIGYGNATTEDWSDIGFVKGKATKDGLQFVNGPKKASDIENLVSECRRLADFFISFHVCLLQRAVAANCIEENDGKMKRWIRKTPTS